MEFLYFLEGLRFPLPDKSMLAVTVLGVGSRGCRCGTGSSIFQNWELRNELRDH